MKKSKYALILLLAASTLSAVYAQYTYKPFRVDLGAGMSFDLNGDLGVGFLTGAEPKYAITDKISIGLRWELNALMTFDNIRFYNVTIYEQTQENFESRISHALTPTFDYHFTTSTFRPFIGAGIGWYGFSGYKISNKEPHDVHVQRSSGNKPGFMLRAGFDVTHFRLALTFNCAGKDNANMNYNYLGLVATGYIGGGKIKQIRTEQLPAL